VIITDVQIVNGGGLNRPGFARSRRMPTTTAISFIDRPAANLRPPLDDPTVSLKASLLFESAKMGLCGQVGQDRDRPEFEYPSGFQKAWPRSSRTRAPSSIAPGLLRSNHQYTWPSLLQPASLVYDGANRPRILVIDQRDAAFPDLRNRRFVYARSRACVE